MEWIEIIKDLNAGTIGGVVGIVAGHPLDTIKVRQQTQSATTSFSRSSLVCIRQVAQREGVRGFYKGMLSPILSNAPINAVVFAVYGQATRFLKERRGGANLTPCDHMMAGSSAGFSQTVFACPAELVKISLQVDSKAKTTSSVDFAKKVVKQHGIQKGLYRGWCMTVARDVPAFGDIAKLFNSRWHCRIDVMAIPSSSGRRKDPCTESKSRGQEKCSQCSWKRTHPTGTEVSAKWIGCDDVYGVNE